MSNRSQFIEEVEEIINNGAYKFSDAALAAFEDYKKEKRGRRKAITENGLKIIKYMQDNLENSNNSFKAKAIGEGLFISGRSVAGSMRKLITDGYVNKLGDDPVLYGLTDLGKSLVIDN